MENKDDNFVIKLRSSFPAQWYGKLWNVKIRIEEVVEYSIVLT